MLPPPLLNPAVLRPQARWPSPPAVRASLPPPPRERSITRSSAAVSDVPVFLRCPQQPGKGKLLAALAHARRRRFMAPPSPTRGFVGLFHTADKIPLPWTCSPSQNQIDSCPLRNLPEISIPRLLLSKFAPPAPLLPKFSLRASPLKIPPRFTPLFLTKIWFRAFIFHLKFRPPENDFGLLPSACHRGEAIDPIIIRSRLILRQLLSITRITH